MVQARLEDLDKAQQIKTRVEVEKEGACVQATDVVIVPLRGQDGVCQYLCFVSQASKHHVNHTCVNTSVLPEQLGPTTSISCPA